MATNTSANVGITKSGTAVVTFPASDSTLATLALTETLTNKTISLASNTVTGTRAQFNTAMSDDDFATLAGTETLTNKTLTTPVLNGTVTGTSATSANNASAIVQRDANGIFVSTNINYGTTVANTSGGPFSLSVSSNYRRVYTGSTATNLDMPVASTLAVGQSWLITNASTAVLTVRSSGANTIAALGAGSSLFITCTTASGTDATSWTAVTHTSADNTQTLTNKRITPRVQSLTSASTITANADTDDAVDVTALAAAPTMAQPSGTPVNFQKLQFRFKDNGTARVLTWNAAFVAGGVALPTTTVISKILTVGFQYNTANALNKWQCIASVQEA